MSGGDDKLVNFVNGGSEKFVERLREEGTECTVETWVQEQTCVLSRPSQAALEGGR